MGAETASAWELRCGGGDGLRVGEPAPNYFETARNGDRRVRFGLRAGRSWRISAAVSGGKVRERRGRPHGSLYFGQDRRFRGGIRGEAWRYDGLDYYCRMLQHRQAALGAGMDNYETPLAAFCNKSAADGARRRDLEWAEADING